MNINNPRKHPKTGYYDREQWVGGPYLIFFDPTNNGDLYIDFGKKFTIKSPFNNDIKNSTKYTINNTYLVDSLIYIGKNYEYQ